MNDKVELSDKELGKVTGGGWIRRLTKRIEKIRDILFSDDKKEEESTTCVATPAEQKFTLKGPEDN